MPYSYDINRDDGIGKASRKSSLQPRQMQQVRRFMQWELDSNTLIISTHAGDEERIYINQAVYSGLKACEYLIMKQLRYS